LLVLLLVRWLNGKTIYESTARSQIFISTSRYKSIVNRLCKRPSDNLKFLKQQLYIYINI
jgi:hypothetical protein